MPRMTRLNGQVAGQEHREPDAEHHLQGERDAGEDEGVLDGLAEGLVAEDVAVVRQADEGAGRSDPVVGEAEVDRHPEGEGDERDEQHDAPAR